MSREKYIRIILALIIALTGSGVILAQKTTSTTKTHIDPKVYYDVSRVVDGDTFNVKVGEKEVKVRLLGVDTPETVDPRKTVQCFGKEASQATKDLLNKHSVRLEIDPGQGETDKYGRILAYAYREDGEFVNAYLLKEGYAHEYTYNKPYVFQKEFKQYEREAQEGKKGLWGELCTQVPEVKL